MVPTPRSKRISQLVETRALVLGRTQVGDADLLLQLLTEERGLLTVAARSARRASSRLGALEPMQTLRVKFALPEGRDIGTLKESVVTAARANLVADEERMLAALSVLRGVKLLVLPGAVDRELFAMVDASLDAISRTEDVARASLHANARIADVLGFSLSFDACVRCGRLCPDGAPALIEPAEGGLVCRACGGGPLRLSAAERRQCAAFMVDETVRLDDGLFATFSRVLDDMLRAHGTLRRRG